MMGKIFIYNAFKRTIFTWTAVAFALYGFSLIVGGVSPWWLLLSWVVTQVFMFSMSVGNHRLFAHRSFECSRSWKWFFAVTSVVAGDDSCYSWAYVHRLHHRFADKPNDPYDATWRYFFRTKQQHVDTTIPSMKWTLKDPLHYYTHKFALLWILAVGAITLSVSKELFVFGYMLPVAWHHITSGLLVIYTHRNGVAVDRPWWWGVFLPSAGEWYHKSHHAPGKAKRLDNRSEPGQIDLGYLFAKMIST